MVFTNQKELEEHTCLAKYNCSKCGKEFAELQKLDKAYRKKNNSCSAKIKKQYEN